MGLVRPIQTPSCTRGFISAIAGLELLFLSIQLICSILTIVYIRRNTLEGNTNVKRAVAKVLAYFAIASILSFINNIFPAINPLIYNAIADDDIATIVAVYYLLRLVVNIPSIATPIVTIVMLKPVCNALKTTIKKICQTRKVPSIMPPLDAWVDMRVLCSLFACAFCCY